LGNDVDPGGGVLVVTSATVPDGAPIAVAVLEHELLRVSEVRPLSEPVTVSYNVSNGQAAADGTVTVVPVPVPAQLQPPIAMDDSAVVRVGDVVTVHPLANDSHPNDEPLTLLPDLVEMPAVGDGLAFVSQDTVRFHAGDEPKTVTVTYQVSDGFNEPAAATIVFRVTAADADGNVPPRPELIEARVVAGTGTQIVVPLDGIDPDGDYVSLVGISSSPVLGEVLSVSSNVIEYRVNDDVAGRDEFTYSVRDRLGATAQGRVVVGVAARGLDNHPPQAVPDHVRVQADRLVAVGVMDNDIDPDGDLLRVVEEGTGSDDVEVSVVMDRLVFRSPAEEGLYSAHYVVADTFGAPSTATVTIEVTAAAERLKPVAVDDLASAEAILIGGESVVLAVLENDSDPDGAIDAVELAVDDPNVTVESDRRVAVPVLDVLQILDYSITDPDGLVGRAFIVVPGLDSIPPTLDSRVEPVTVREGESVEVRLADHLLVAGDKTVRITEAGKVTAQHGNPSVLGEATIRFEAPTGYSGRDSLSVEVTDGTGPDDPNGNVATVAIPVVIEPANGSKATQDPEEPGAANEPTPNPDGENSAPVLTNPSLTVAVGESASVDLSVYAADPDPDDVVGFTLGEASVEGVDLKLDGTTLTAAASTDAQKDTFSVPVTASDGVNPPVEGVASIAVVSSTKPLAATTEMEFPDAHAGVRFTADPLAHNVTNPFPDTPLTLISASAAEGTGTAAVEGAVIVIVPTQDFVGAMMVTYQVRDATEDPEREVAGRIRVVVKARPSKVTGLHVDSIASREVRLSWSVPQSNGSAIEAYNVAAVSGNYSNDCGTATVCTLDGLTNNVEYQFTVTATNAVGTSDPSDPSAKARPDAVPSAPGAPVLEFGDSQLEVSWSEPENEGSPILTYELQISPRPPSGEGSRKGVTGTSLVWKGLENGTAYQVRVCGRNSAETACSEEPHWSAYSDSETPAAPPDPPATPGLKRLDPVGVQGQIEVSWSKPAINGDEVSKYQVIVYQGGTQVKTVAVDPDQTAQAVVIDVSETDYSFAVTAQNKAGVSGESEKSSMRSVIAPGVVTQLAVTDLDQSAKVDFGAAPGNGAQAAEISYEYTLGGASAAKPIKSGETIGGLTNNETYTVKVRAVSHVEGDSFGGPWTEFPNVRPYGKVKSPSLLNMSAETSGIRVTFRWNTDTKVLRNGRDIASVQVCADGNCANKNNGVLTVGNGPDQRHSFSIQVTSTAGDSAEHKIEGVTASPSVTVSAGGGKMTSYCTSTYCKTIVVQARNFAPNTTYDVSFSTDCNTWSNKQGCLSGGGSSMDPYITVRLTTDGNGNFDNTERAFGYPGAAVWVRVGGLGSNRAIF
jgi:hypothetical protein